MTEHEAPDEAARIALLRFAQEALYCERILAKGGDSILSAALARVEQPTFWTHYPEGEVFDADSGAQWFYHSHAGEAEATMPGEHGHFHCFLRPEGRPGPIHHLVAVSVDEMGKLQNLFTVAQHVVDDIDIPPDARIALLERFDVQLGKPDYLVNRWLTAVIGLYQEEISVLIREGARRAAADGKLSVTACLSTSLRDKARSLGLAVD